MNGRAAGVMLILALSWGGCAPMRETRSETILAKRVERSGESRIARSGRGSFRIEAEGDSAVVRIDWEPRCSPIETEHLVVREELRRSPATDIVIAEAAVATLGALLMAYSFTDGGPSEGRSGCDASYPGHCYSNSGLTGAAFVIGAPMFFGGAMAVAVDMAARRRETRTRQVDRQVRTARVEPCREHSIAGSAVALVVGGHSYGGRLGQDGSARIPIPGAEWHQHPNGLDATLVLEGVEVGRVIIRRAAQEQPAGE